MNIVMMWTTVQLVVVVVVSVKKSASQRNLLVCNYFNKKRKENEVVRYKRRFLNATTFCLIVCPVTVEVSMYSFLDLAIQKAQNFLSRNCQPWICTFVCKFYNPIFVWKGKQVHHNCILSLFKLTLYFSFGHSSSSSFLN